MKLTTKGEIVLAALRKASLASNATLTDVDPQSLEDGLEDLDLMMFEWLMDDDRRGIDVGYAFSDSGVSPLPEDAHNLPDFCLNAVLINLAVRMMPDYGQEAPARLVAKASYGKERILKWLAKSRTPHLSYPDRMPTGSGNRHSYRYFRGVKHHASDPTSDN
ncbi:recombinase RmuC [Erwinia psidii]|uniref:packaged DNA stabilization gp4 family protein n=1 Tax=Erwinia psidii TaxID=69224 RepID=UPI00226B0C0F|nr:packaged DNA stabilization gp4 family protein [Erwinia psidii]MCX8958319.1 recombinase RmuC [Erwinia psidii]MCX8963251.1 recombinase RmuC [Erwinia psidii]